MSENRKVIVIPTITIYKVLKKSLNVLFITIRTNYLHY